MFEASTESPEPWKTVMQSVSAVVEECTFSASPEGLSLRAMDPSRVALLDLEWPSAAFEKYQCDGEQELTVRVDDIAKLFRRAGTG